MSLDVAAAQVYMRISLHGSHTLHSKTGNDEAPLTDDLQLPHV